ncbi:MAG TPA: nickel pincer cofactor biosynthesis protein LarC [Candidatus Polarisedimenticolaceae bacterium]|nr:nickel pincer cofactor biosynthesis protein LarC [Candidatus Polarisedimenticolaceae bacterium]
MSRDERVLWIDAAAGASGDMILGALVDAGAPFAAVKRAIASLKLPGLRVAKTATVRGAVSATKVDIRVAGHDHDDHHLHERGRGHHGRSFRQIRGVIAGAAIEPAVRDRALVIFRRLIEAEGLAHGLAPDAVHLHEAGAADAIADVVGVAAALHALAPDRVIVSPITTGSGTVACAHGLYPVPGPATSHLLSGVPLSGIDAEGERLTPTGAAILTTIAQAYGGPPAMTLSRVGHGAGARDYPERPNVVRALLGARRAGAAASEVVVVELTLDDATPQLIAYAVERLFAAGALDVQTTSVQMKKGRSGHNLTVLARPEAFDAVSRAALSETTTFGLRFRREERIELDRSTQTVATRFGRVRLKIGRLDGVEIRAEPEYDDCAAAARKHGVSFDAVHRAAVAARRGRTR